MHRVRELRGAKSQSTSISRIKPCLELGIKRSTWYSQHRWTDSCAVKLISSENETVQAENRLVSSKESAEKELSVVSVQSTLKAQEPEMLVTDAALLICERTCPTTEEQSSIGDLRGMPADLSKYYAAQSDTVRELLAHTCLNTEQTVRRLCLCLALAVVQLSQVALALLRCPGL